MILRAARGGSARSQPGRRAALTQLDQFSDVDLANAADDHGNIVADRLSEHMVDELKSGQSAVPRHMGASDALSSQRAALVVLCDTLRAGRTAPKSLLASGAC